MGKRYKISDIERILKVDRRTYYRWEKLKKIPPAKRDPMSKQRYWTDEDVKKLREITER